VCAAGCGAGSIDFWVPHPRGCGWRVYMLSHSPHTPFPLAPVRYYIMRSKSWLPFLLPPAHAASNRVSHFCSLAIQFVCYCRGAKVIILIHEVERPLIPSCNILPGWIVFRGRPPLLSPLVANKLALSASQSTIDLEMKTHTTARISRSFD
jgi:hypothetical protein